MTRSEEWFVLPISKLNYIINKILLIVSMFLRKLLLIIPRKSLKLKSLELLNYMKWDLKALFNICSPLFE